MLSSKVGVSRPYNFGRGFRERQRPRIEFVATTGPAQNGGYTADYVYSGINLANGDDEIVLIDLAGQTVDRVAYTGAAPWPVPTGRSMELQNPSLDNNDGLNWSEATTRGGSFDASGADQGTPGTLLD